MRTSTRPKVRELLETLALIVLTVLLLPLAGVVAGSLAPSIPYVGLADLASGTQGGAPSF